MDFAGAAPRCNRADHRRRAKPAPEECMLPRLSGTIPAPSTHLFDVQRFGDEVELGAEGVHILFQRLDGARLRGARHAHNPQAARESGNGRNAGAGRPWAAAPAAGTTCSLRPCAGPGQVIPATKCITDGARPPARPREAQARRAILRVADRGVQAGRLTACATAPRPLEAHRPRPWQGGWQPRLPTARAQPLARWRQSPRRPHWPGLPQPAREPPSPFSQSTRDLLGLVGISRRDQLEGGKVTGSDGRGLHHATRAGMQARAVPRQAEAMATSSSPAPSNTHVTLLPKRNGELLHSSAAAPE